MRQKHLEWRKHEQFWLKFQCWSEKVGCVQGYKHSLSILRSWTQHINEWHVWCQWFDITYGRERWEREIREREREREEKERERERERERESERERGMSERERGREGGRGREGERERERERGERGRERVNSKQFNSQQVANFRECKQKMHTISKNIFFLIPSQFNKWLKCLSILFKTVKWIQNTKQWHR